MLMTLMGTALVSLGCAVMEPREDSVRLWVEPQANWQERYRLVVEMSMSSEGQTNMLKQNADLRLVIVSADPDGSALIRTTVERIESAAEVEGQTLTYPVVVNEDEATDDSLAAMYEALKDTVIELQLRPDGTLELVSGLDRVLEVADAARPDGQQFLGAFVPGSFERTVSYMLTADPERQPRHVNEKWADDYTIPVFGGRQARVTMASTLNAVREAQADVAGEITLELVPLERPQAWDPALRIVQQSGTLNAKWDVEARRLLERSASTEVVWGAQLGADPEVETTATIRMKIDLSLLDDAQAPAIDNDGEQPGDGPDVVSP